MCIRARSPAVCSGYRTRETPETPYARQVAFWLGMGYSQSDAEAEACLMVALSLIHI